MYAATLAALALFALGGQAQSTDSAASPVSSSSSTSTASAPAASASGNTTEYVTGALAALQAAGLTELATALQAAGTADPSLLNAIVEGEHTVFAPTNDALSALGAATANTSVLGPLLSYHILEGYVDPSSLTEGTHTIVRSSLKGAPYVQLPGNQSQVVVLTSTSGNVTVVEPAANITAVGSAIYQNVALEVVPTALSIPGTLSATLTNVSDLSSLVTAATGASAAIVPALEAITGVTIFAPVNSAFTAAQSVLSSANASTIADVLLNHVVNGTAVYSSLISPDQNVTSAGGSPLSFVSNSSGVFVSSGSATARILQTDIIVSNGVVHTIDAILLNTASDPSAAASAASSQSAAGATQTATQTGAVAGGGGGGSGGSPSTTASERSSPSNGASNSASDKLIAPAITTSFLGWIVLALFA